MTFSFDRNCNKQGLRQIRIDRLYPREKYTDTKFYRKSRTIISFRQTWSPAFISRGRERVASNIGVQLSSRDRGLSMCLPR